MVDIEVETHANGIGGDEIVDLARLVERNLGIAGLRAERAHHHGSAAAKTAQHLGNGVNLFGREGDDRAARRNPRQLARAGVAERGKARAADDFGLGQQLSDHWFERRRAEQHGFLAAARVQQPVGENVAPLAVCGQLRLVERDESEICGDRHRLGSAQQPARVLGFDPLLAGDQRDPVFALDCADPVVDLACQKPEGKTDHAARMCTQPLDRQVGLAGVGRAEHGLDPRRVDAR